MWVNETRGGLWGLGLSSCFQEVNYQDTHFQFKGCQVLFHPWLTVFTHSALTLFIVNTCYLISSPWLVLPFLSVPIWAHWTWHTCVGERMRASENDWLPPLLSHSCCILFPLLFAADVRTTFSPITSKGTSCFWTIRWGNAWLHGPVSRHELNSQCNALLWMY